MYSQRQFTPGNNSSSFKVTQRNKYSDEKVYCDCIHGQFQKFTTGSESASTRSPNKLRVSQIIKYSKGGKTQYGNSYLGKPININYLGKAEGMPGGGGGPPLNKFN